MNVTDTPFYRAFAARVRDHLDTVSTAPEGSPTMDTATAETTGTAAEQLAAFCETNGIILTLNAADLELYREDGVDVYLYVPAGFDLADILVWARERFAALGRVPAAFLAAPGAPCELNAWCVQTGSHVGCNGSEVDLPPAWESGFPTLVGHLHYDAEDDVTSVIYQRSEDDWNRLTSDELRAETARVRAHLARLDALADQLDAIHEAGGSTPQAAVAEPAAAPRTWSFISRDTGLPRTVTCMQGCTRDHSTDEDLSWPIFPQDAGCSAEEEREELLVQHGPSEPDEYEVLSFGLYVDPFSMDRAKRLPYMAIEIINDHVIEGADPDTVEAVANFFQRRIDAIRAAVPALRAIRTEYAPADPMTEHTTADDNAGKATPAGGEATLSSDVLDLLTAIRDALDVPLPGVEDRDERRFCWLLDNRRSTVYSTLSALLDGPTPKIYERDAQYIRRRTADTPVTYTVWRDPEPAGGEQA